MPCAGEAGTGVTWKQHLGLALVDGRDGETNVPGLETHSPWIGCRTACPRPSLGLPTVAASHPQLWLLLPESSAALPQMGPLQPLHHQLPHPMW